MSFVLDNSVTMRWYFGDGSMDDSLYAERVLDRLNSDEAFVPVIWALEVANVLARAEAKQLTTEARSREFLELLATIGVNVDDQTFTRAFGDTLSLARRYNLSAYDASYLELAMREAIPIATLDERLKEAALRVGVPLFAQEAS